MESPERTQKRKLHDASSHRHSSSNTTASSSPASRLHWLFYLLIVASLLSAGGISYRVTLAPRMKRAATLAHGGAQTLVAKKQTSALEEEREVARLNGTTGDAATTPLNPKPLVDGVVQETSEAPAKAAEGNLPASPRTGDQLRVPLSHDETLVNSSTLEYTGIPRIIHQSWKSHASIPKRFQPWMRSWTNMHPAWTYVFWTDADNLALFQKLYPEYLHVAKSVGKIGLADMARYALLHSVGGLYVDADFECVKPFDQLLRENELFLSSEPRVHSVLLENSDSVVLCNALMASKPKHRFWLRVLDAIKTKFEREGNNGPVGLTGPLIVKQTYNAQFRDDASVAIFPQEYFYPEIAYWNIGKLEEICRKRSDPAAQEVCSWLTKFPQGEFTANTHATHHWQCTWCIGDRTSEYVSLQEVFRAGPRSGNMPQKPQISNEAIAFTPMID